MTASPSQKAAGKGEQYSLARILGIWVAAAVPIGIPGLDRRSGTGAQWCPRPYWCSGHQGGSAHHRVGMAVCPVHDPRPP